LDCKQVIIETAYPRLFDTVLEQHNIQDIALLNRLQTLSFIEYKNYFMVSETTNQRVAIESALPSLSALEILMRSFGYKLENNYTELIKSNFPKNFEGRYSCSFIKYIIKPLDVLPSFEESYKKENKLLESISSEINSYEGSWIFDKSVASVFVQHAEQHIPKYYEVIEQSVQMCEYFIKNKNEKIIDIGCATGKTIETLHNRGFTNLVGVDNSQDMLDCITNKDIANYIFSDTLPADNYSAVICNWTLHFINQKELYLQSIYKNLKPNGILVLSDKTKNEGIELDLYHQFKKSRGVTQEEIIRKANSLIGKMFIDSEFWYIETCKRIGFSEVSIINSAPCFTTFLIVK